MKTTDGTEGGSRGGSGNGWLFEPSFNRSIQLRHARSADHIRRRGAAAARSRSSPGTGRRPSGAAQLPAPGGSDSLHAGRVAPPAPLRHGPRLCPPGRSGHPGARRGHEAGRLGTAQQAGRRRAAGQPSDWRLIERLAEIKSNLETTRAALPQWVGRHQHTSPALSRQRRARCLRAHCDAVLRTNSSA